MVTIRINKNIELRTLRSSDAVSIFNLIDSQREYLGKWLPFVATTLKLDDTVKAMEFMVSTENPTFAIVSDGCFIGLIGFKGADHANHRVEIGYWMSKDYQGQGIMTQSVNALCSYAFEIMNMNRIQIKCAVGNIPSGNIPKRLGFYFEGIERAGECYSEDSYFDIEVYSKLKND